MDTLDAATKQSLQNALYAYLNQYGGESLADARAIAGALLSVQEQAGKLAASGWEIEDWVNDLVSDFDPKQISSAVNQAAAASLANQTKHWRELLENKTRSTFDAYIQKYAPALDTPTLEQLVVTILPIVEDATITRDEARRLILAISDQIDVPEIANRHIDPHWLLLADQVQQMRQYRELEEPTADIMHAYIHKFQPMAVEIGEALVERAIEAVSNSRLKLGLEVELDPETRKLLIKQVMLKVRLRDLAPPPTKTALEIAQELHSEVTRYRRDRGLDKANYLPAVTITDKPDGEGLLGGEFSVGINLKPRRPNDKVDDEKTPTDT
ncbi:MAG: hypothetical protein AAGG53_12895 [Cyanobacteria bacterium P01_H01_bin.152]